MNHRLTCFLIVFALVFSSTQSRNWDGGYQELTTTAQCVRQVFPDSKIIPNRTNTYPIQVTVDAEYGDKTVQVWSGKQQRLFAKNRNKRIKTMEEIKMKLKSFKDGI